MLRLRVAQRDEYVTYLRCNHRKHELVWLGGAETACDGVAREVLDLHAYEEVISCVTSEGLLVFDRRALQPGLQDAIRFVVPGGFTIEVLCGMAYDHPTSYDSIASRPLKLEHITLKSSQKPELENVLIRVLGLRLSDRAEDAISWLRASDEHHDVSVIAAEADALHDYACPFDTFGAFARIGDHLMEHGPGFLWGPGHHGIGNNYSATRSRPTA